MRHGGYGVLLEYQACLFLYLALCISHASHSPLPLVHQISPVHLSVHLLKFVCGLDIHHVVIILHVCQSDRQDSQALHPSVCISFCVKIPRHSTHLCTFYSATSSHPCVSPVCVHLPMHPPSTQARVLLSEMLKNRMEYGDLARLYDIKPVPKNAKVRWLASSLCWRMGCGEGGMWGSCGYGFF